MAKLLNVTQVAKRAGLSAKKFNEILYAKNVINHRGRPSHHGGGSVKFYENKVDDLLRHVGLGGIL